MRYLHGVRGAPVDLRHSCMLWFTPFVQASISRCLSGVIFPSQYRSQYPQQSSCFIIRGVSVCNSFVCRSTFARTSAVRGRHRTLYMSSSIRLLYSRPRRSQCAPSSYCSPICSQSAKSATFLHTPMDTEQCRLFVQI